MKELLKAKSEFRKKGVVLTADKIKSGVGGSWRFAGEDNLIRTIQEPLSSCGLELIATMGYEYKLNVNTVKVTLFHIESGESIDSQISFQEVIPRKDKNGNSMYLDAEIERGKQFGYWSRMLSIRILGLSDIDPEDTMNIPSDITDEAIQKSFDKLEALLNSSSTKEKTIEWVNKRFSVDDYKKLNVNQLNEVCVILASKANASN